MKLTVLSVVMVAITLSWGPRGLLFSDSEGESAPAAKYIPMQVAPKEVQKQYAAMMTKCILNEGIEKYEGAMDYAEGCGCLAEKAGDEMVEMCCIMATERATYDAEMIEIVSKGNGVTKEDAKHLGMIQKQNFEDFQLCLKDPKKYPAERSALSRSDSVKGGFGGQRLQSSAYVILLATLIAAAVRDA